MKIKLIYFALLFSFRVHSFTDLETLSIKRADSLVECSEIQLNAGMYDAAIESLMRVKNASDNISYKVFQRLSYIFMLKKDFVKSLDYANLALKVSKKTNNSHDIGWSYSRIANVLLETNDLDGAEKNYTYSIAEFQKIGDKKSKSQAINNLGLLYQKQNRLDEAEKMFLEAYIVAKEIKYFMFQVYIENELGDLYRIKKQYNKSEEFFDLAVKGEKEAGYATLSQSLFYNIHELYKEIGNFSKSVFYLEKYSTLSDSLNLINQNQRILDTETKFRTKEKEKEITFLNKENELQQAQIKKRNIILVLSGLVILIIGSLIVIVQRARKRQVESNFILEQKNKEIEFQKKEIVSSINYAERIQRSLLASDYFLSNNLPDYFILFKPKDIVSGDFYWGSKLDDNNFVLITADSTGHGVPGALMSILNISCIEKAVESEKLTEPAAILNHTRAKIIETLKKDGSADGGKDGMDASLICFDFKNSKMTYAAANNPIWIVRQNELVELKGDKMPVGKHDKDQVPFTQHEFELNKGDIVYTLTDGFPDQFGGPIGKKYMYKKLKETLLSISSKPLIEQKETLNSILKEWMGDAEQVDDITIIGIRI